MFEISCTCFSTLQEAFFNTMHTIVSKKQAYKVKREEGWYSVDEMKKDLGWSQWEPHHFISATDFD